MRRVNPVLICTGGPSLWICCSPYLLLLPEDTHFLLFHWLYACPESMKGFHCHAGDSQKMLMVTKFGDRRVGNLPVNALHRNKSE